MAKISCRLVPDQEPEEVHQQMLAYLAANAPNTVRYELELISVGSTAISDRESTGAKAMSEALDTVWGKRPVFRREGGTIPVVAMFKDYLDVESVNTGFSLPDDNLHAPNEKIHLPTWERGVEAIIHFFYNL
jgi:acetylornithine deacetylase/succinyl-diaminopimelate desuccinylase-like protein